ncbi:hypothetical protein GF377_07285, partial [candidate division GN15 bacterium]|nr:hypothetical protein [candidate division GN15 bacterium]
ASQPHELGLFLLLVADSSFFEGRYQRAIEAGLKAARILAEFPLNSRYGRVQLVLSKAYHATGDMKNAEIRARDAVAAYRRASETLGLVDSLNQLAGVYYMRCDYVSTADFLEDALKMASGDVRRESQIVGNLGRTRIRTGQWDQAEEDLLQAIRSTRDIRRESSEAMNLLSLGFLRLRRRQFTEGQRALDDALEIISRLDLKRERVIYLEYAGELAFEKGDTFKAKAILSEAYRRGLGLAPSSALVTQSGRRLAEVELALDNYEEAMKSAQKALDLALQLGERIEAGLAHALIARVFSAKSDHDSAMEHIRHAVVILRDVGDPYELGRVLLIEAELRQAAGHDNASRLRATIDEANAIFRGLSLDYWIHESDYRSGVLSCQLGDLAGGFRKLSRAERGFAQLNLNTRVRSVSGFLRSLSEQAVALSISEDNEFKAFGKLISPEEYTDLNTGTMDAVIDVLLNRAGGSRAVVYVPDSEDQPVWSSVPLEEDEIVSFVENFGRLLGNEVHEDRPTLILDCRRDPFIKKLFDSPTETVGSMIVVPFRISGGHAGYLYVDRLDQDKGFSPFNQTELNFAVGFTDLIAFKWTELQKNQLLEDNRRLRRQLMEQAAFPNIITSNNEMHEMLNQVRQVVDSSISVAIEGETGSGKDLLARAIHYNSGRRDRRFISVNCAALPESLLESELFGYKRGAFTGADRDKPGLFEEADGGTFFLDEIGDMPLSIQAKVLRVLEEKEIVRLGETVPRKVDVRIVSATNRDLAELMAQCQFREDLYYRLCAMSFRLPSLRERKEDIPLLVNHFAERSGKRFSSEIMSMLVTDEWPGNIRELENEVRKMILLSGDEEEVPTRVVSAKILEAAGKQGMAATGVVPTLGQVEFNDRFGLYDFLAEHEKQFIVDALRARGGVKKHAAALLHIPESTLRLKIKQYDIDLSRLGSAH